MPLTSEQLKARTDLARKQTSRWDTPTKFKTWTTVTETWFQDKLRKDAAANAARIEKKRQACAKKWAWWAFDPVSESCRQSWIQTEQFTWETPSFRWKQVSKEQEALNLIARWDIAQVAEWDISWLSEIALAALAWARKQEEEKTELEKKLEATRVKREKETRLKQKALEAAAPWVEVWVEAPTLALARWVEWILTERAAIIEEEFAFNQQAITDAQTALDEALRTWRVDLVKQARASMLDLRKQELNLKAQATSDVLETMWDTLLGKSEEELQQIALDQNVDLWLLKLQQEKLQLADKTAEAKTKIATTKASDTKVTDALNTWLLTWWTSEQLTSFAEWSSYTPWELSLLAKQKEEIMNMKDDDPLLAEKKRKYNAEISKIEAQTVTELGVDITTQQRVWTPTWKLTSLELNWRNITLDEVASWTINKIDEELKAMWIESWLMINQSYRSAEHQKNIILDKAVEFWIETSWKTIAEIWDEVRAKWFPVANPWESKHQTWMSIDIPWELVDKPWFVELMRKNWWEQITDPKIRANDRWHFNFIWKEWTPKVLKVSDEASSWVDSWNKWALSLDKILTKIWSSKEWLKLKNEVIQAVSAQWWIAWREDSDPAVQSVKALEDSVQELIDDKNDQMENVTWVIQTDILDVFNFNKEDYLTTIDFLLSWQTLQALIDAKAAWATFGALSNEELKLLQNSASELASAIVRDEDTQRATWMNMSEDKFKAKLGDLLAKLKWKADIMTWKWIKEEKWTDVPNIKDLDRVRTIKNDINKAVADWATINEIKDFLIENWINPNQFIK